MKRAIFVIATVLTCLSLHLFAEEPTVARRKAETIAQADKLFGQRYIPAAGKPARAYDKQTETSPPESVIYWHGANYVVELVFAADGTIAGLLLHPEALLYSKDWNDAPSAAELSNADMHWFVTSANVMRPLGKARNRIEAPNGCFQSGRNLYCNDTYELASVYHYHVETTDAKHVTVVVLKNIWNLVPSIRQWHCRGRERTRSPTAAQSGWAVVSGREAGRAVGEGPERF